MKLRVRLKGGPGSGHHGHAGIPGKQGGSLPGSGGSGGIPVKDVMRDAHARLSTLTHFAPNTVRPIKRQLADKYGIRKEFDEFEQKLLSWTESPDNTALLDELEANTPVVQFNKAVNQMAYNAQWAKEHPLLKYDIPDSITVYRGGDIDRRFLSFTNDKAKALEFATSLADEYGGDPKNYLIEATIDPKSVYVNFINYDIGGRWGEGELLVDTEHSGLDYKEYKGGPGSGHYGHAGIPGHHGGSAPGTGTTTSNKLPPEQRVWQGRQQTGKVPFNQNEVGRRGEVITTKAMQDMFGTEFSLMNEGLNNAPIDVAGDHRAIEVKTGVATNGRSAQQWRITTSYTAGPTERGLIAAMTKSERSEYNRYKQTQSMLRKRQAVKEMSDIAGATIEPATVGVILSPDGTKGDVFYVPGFHLRLGWNHYATDEYYIGTYDVE